METTKLEIAGEQLVRLGTEYGLKLVGAVIILLVGRLAARIIHGILVRGLGRLGADPTVTGFTSSLAYWSVIVFAVVAALSKFGVQTASFVAVLGAASFAVGLALQGSLSNFAAGVMILLFRPFRVGDRIETTGVTGSVQAIEMFATILRSDDNVKIIVPNGKLYSDVIKNHSAYVKES